MKTHVLFINPIVKFFNHGTSTAGYPLGKIINLYPYFIQYTVIKLDLITGLMEGNIGHYLWDFQVLKYFLDKTHSVQTIEEKSW